METEDVSAGADSTALNYGDTIRRDTGGAGDAERHHHHPVPFLDLEHAAELEQSFGRGDGGRGDGSKC